MKHLALVLAAVAAIGLSAQFAEAGTAMANSTLAQLSAAAPSWHGHHGYHGHHHAYHHGYHRHHGHVGLHIGFYPRYYPRYHSYRVYRYPTYGYGYGYYPWYGYRCW